MPKEILIPLQSLVSFFLEPPAKRWAAVGAIEGLWRGYSLVSADIFGIRHYLLNPSSCYPSQWGFLCPLSSLCQGSGQ